MLRAQQIIIDTPTKSQEPWITVVLQDVTEDANGNVIQTVDRVGMIHRQLNSVAPEMTSFSDPVTGKVMSSSIAGLASAIRVAVVKWISEDYANY